MLLLPTYPRSPFCKLSVSRQKEIKLDAKDISGNVFAMSTFELEITARELKTENGGMNS